MRKEYIIGFALVLSVFLISFVSAGIIFSQPKGLYSLGDEIEFEAQVSSFSSGYFVIDLVCGEESKNVFNSVMSKKKVSIKLPLSSLYIGNLSGDCFFAGEYGGESQTSERFEISNNIAVEFDLKDMEYKAGENVVAKGTALKENNKLVGQDYEGFVEISAGDSELKYTGIVKDGGFSVNFTLRDDMKAGNYMLKAYVYEKDAEGGVLNFGENLANIKIKQEIKRIDIALSEQNFEPGDVLKFLVLVYDQAGDKVPAQVGVEVLNSEGERVFERIVKSDESINLTLQDNSPAGYWRIIAREDEVEGESLFNVREQENARFELQNNTLIITNTGNVPYKKSIQIAIGGEIIIKEIDLKVGEVKKMLLAAPEGGYKISITDGSTTISEEEVLLTGNVVGVKDVRKGLGLFTKYPIVWLFLIVMFGLFILMLVQRVKKKKSVSYAPEKFEKNKRGMFFGLIKKERSDGGAVKAEHGLVSHGEKQNVAIVAVKIKSKIDKAGRENLEKAFEEAYEKKGACYESGDYFLLVFSPLLTKSFKNEVVAVKAAMNIEKALKEANKKFKDKIEFGVGVNTGEIINKFEDRKLKFTALGKTLNSVKKIADISNGEVLVGKEIHEKARQVHVEKDRGGGELEVFRVKGISPTDNKRFVRDFLKRIEGGEKEK